MNPYPLLYRLGITPWDREEVPRQVRELAQRSSPAGPALDIGCGTGRDAVFLAKRGWAVTAVDSVPRALDAARRRSAAAEVDVKWVLGDVTRLSSLGIGDGYELLVDRGCFHGLGEEERTRCAEGLAAVSAPGAKLLMFAFQPRSRGIGPRGLTSEQLTRCLGDEWELAGSEPESEIRLARWIGDAKPIWYQLTRAA